MPVFLFTDIENSTKLWEKHESGMGEILSRHDAILSRSLAKFGGKIIKHRGDGIFAVFEAGEPLACALEIQKEIQHENWGAIGGLRVRMALHAGPAERREDDYFGSAVNRTARILDIGWGGQTLVTPEAMKVCRLPEGARVQDLGLHYLKDLNEPQKVFGFLHPEIPLGEFPPLRSLSNHPNNLPPQPTPFIGRASELAELGRLLGNEECRLITLLGPGGIGKTRLAIQAASEQSDAFSQGAYFVDLSPLSSREFLISAIAQSLRFTFYGQGELKAQLLNYLREKKMLLVLDNFEHLLEGAPLVSEIISVSSGIKIIATSRERLNLKGEWIQEIGGMRLPQGNASQEAGGAMQFFEETAKRVSPGFSMAEGAGPQVERICRLLSGMPLGIELAASWTRSLSCEEIAKEIELNLDFLAVPLRDLPERHRSLRAVFEHSWNLLSEYEKSTLRKIAAFRGGFSKDGAKAVAGASLPILSLLVDKSLLRKAATGRYEVHPMVRQYAEERLEDEQGERERVEALHAQYYAVFLQQKEKDLRGGKQKEAMTLIVQELENVRAAWSRLIAAKNGEEIDKCLHSLYLFYRMESLYGEGEEAFSKAAAALEAEPYAQVAARLVVRQGIFCRIVSRYEKAKELLEKSLAFFRAAGNRWEIACCLQELGRIAWSQGQSQQAESLAVEAIGLFKELQDPAESARALNVLADIAWGAGKYPESREMYDECFQIFKNAGDLFGSSYVSMRRGLAVSLLGDYPEARRLYEEALDLAGQIGSRFLIMNAQHDLGYVLFLLGRFEDGKILLEKSLVSAREMGNRLFEASALEDLGKLAQATGKLDDAGGLFRESLAILRESGDKWQLGLTLSSMGNLACISGSKEEALKYFRESLKTAEGIRSVPLVLQNLAGIAALIYKDGKKEEAGELVRIVFGNPASPAEAKDQIKNFCAEYNLALDATTVDEGKIWEIAAGFSRG